MAFLINSAGLSTGLAGVLLIFLWVRDEQNVDQFHQNDARLFEVITHYQEPNGNIGTGNFTSGLLAETLPNDMPEIELMVASRVLDDGMNVSIGRNSLKARVQYASEDYFKMFSYDLLQGITDQVLKNKNSIVLSDQMAIKLFGTTQDVVGKFLELGQDKKYQVSGVFKETQPNSSIQFDLVLPFEAYKENNNLATNWEANTVQSYIVLKEGTDINNFNKKIADYAYNKTTEASPFTIALRKYSDAYLYGKYENGKQVGGRIEYVRLFSLIALFILIIASINFMNLSTANASRRLREIGVKKTFGAKRGDLIFQFLGESVCMALLSLLGALVLVWITMPQFNEVTGKQLEFDFNFPLIVTILAITLLTGIIAGSYPALYLSAFKPIKVLKGKINNSFGEIWIRKGLVVFQFALSILLIVGVVVVYKQIEFVQNKNLGYDRENVLYVDIEGKIEENLETFLEQARNIPGIINAGSIGDHLVGGDLNGWIIDEWEGKDKTDRTSFQMRAVSTEMIETLGIKMKSGRTFSNDFSTDNSKIIFNEAAIEYMGLEDPIGKTISIQGTQLEILGVSKNFHFASLHEKVNPLFFVLQPSWTDKVMVKIETANVNKTIKNFEELYRSFNSGFPFEYHFLDEAYEAQYVAEQRVATLSKYFGGLAILISCLGLFGLAAFTAERRKKEIGIRKVLGQSASQVTMMLSGQFAQLVLISILIALPIAFLLADDWLSDFAYRIPLKVWYFLGAGLIALLIAMLTVVSQSIRAALANPVNSLRTE
ncbi:ABC transporter permease [Gramella sp. AN32]|uniref:ABC transporter permease n=1 Tax=Christiangramia antarctica TaxID=2058158 RepID=A0ABW5X3I4_9FLAO|nr:ABC transporter permease [Gramella sp. AN32]